MEKINKKILVIGGTRFIGRHLVQNLINKGHQVTVLNRGNNQISFSGPWESLVCDRDDSNKMKQLVFQNHWDLVYDHVCYDYQQAKKACEIFSGRVGKYIFISSKSVYPEGAYLKEEDFNPDQYHFEKEIKTNENYAEAKRQAETAFVRYADFPVVMVRFPIVIGINDYTKRLLFHIERVQKSEPIYFPNINALMTFVDSREAAQALELLGEVNFQGPINVASPDPICLKDVIGLIEEVTGSKAVLLDDYSEKDHSPYGIGKDWFMDCYLLKELGLELSPVKEKLQENIKKITSSLLP